MKEFDEYLATVAKVLGVARDALLIIVLSLILYVGASVVSAAQEAATLR